MTLHDRYIKFFRAQGYIVIPHRTAKYTVLHNIDSRGNNMYIFLGEKGAIRYSKDGRVNKSKRVENAKAVLEIWEKEQQ